MEQAKFTYSLLWEVFEKQTKTMEHQGKKQVDALKVLKRKQLKAVKDNKSDDNEKLLKYKKIFWWAF